MGRFALFVIGLAAVIAFAMPSGPRAPASEEQQNQAILIDSGEPEAAAEEADSPSPLFASEIRLERAADGHFYTDAEVNGTRVRFLVDTGATSVALTEADARRVGIPFFSSEFTVVGRGASGDVRGKFVRLDRIAIGNARVTDVDAAILADSDVSLLGQSFLRRLDTVEIRDDRMVMR